MIDYELAAHYREFYLVDGFNAFNLLLKQMKDDKSVVSIKIDAPVWNQAHNLTQGVGVYKKIIDKTYYAGDRKIIEERLEKIQELGLEEFEHLILILLTVAPWGLEERQVDGLIKLVPPGKSDHKNEADEYRKGASDNDKLFRLLQHENHMIQGGMPSILNEPLKWRFKSAEITFYNVDNPSIPYLKLPSNEKGSEIFAELIIDCMKDLLLGDVTIYEKIETWEQYASCIEERSIQVSNPHYIFTYNFVNFLRNNTIYSGDRYSTNDVYKVYITLMDLTSFKIKGYEIESNRVSTIKQWYSRGKIIVDSKSVE